jgi:sodium/potassium-transporting ATPase subunit alpha
MSYIVIKNVHDSKEHLVDWKLFINGCFINGPLTTLLIYVNVILYLTLYTQHSPGEFLRNYFDIIDLPTQNVVQTVSFYAIVCMQVFGNLWAIRSRNVSIFKSLPFVGPKRNIPMLLSALGVYLVTIVLINVPWANNLIGTTPIPWPFYLFPFVYSFIIIIFNEIRLLITRFKLFEKIAVW